MKLGPNNKSGSNGSRVSLIVLAAGLLWPISSFSGESAVFKTGNQLYEVCTADSASLKMITCLGYVAGLSDMLQDMKKTCAPRDVTQAQTRDVIVTYFRAHPEVRHNTASGEGAHALMNAFPCK